MAVPTGLPTFNVMMGVWRPGNTPAGGPPALSILTQLYFHSRGDWPFTEGTPGTYAQSTFIRIPTASLLLIGTPAVGSILGGAVGGAGAWYWKVRRWEFTHLGFANQYVTFLVEQCDPTGVSPDAGR